MTSEWIRQQKQREYLPHKALELMQKSLIGFKQVTVTESQMFRPLKVTVFLGLFRIHHPTNCLLFTWLCMGDGGWGIKAMKTMTWNLTNLINRKQTDRLCCDQQLPWTSLWRHPAVCLPEASRGWWLCLVTRPFLNLLGISPTNECKWLEIHLTHFNMKAWECAVPPYPGSASPHWCPCSRLPQQPLHRGGGGLGWQCFGFILGTWPLFIPAHFR